jgi:hypothetical protein
MLSNGVSYWDATAVQHMWAGPDSKVRPARAAKRLHTATSFANIPTANVAFGDACSA